MDEKLGIRHCGNNYIENSSYRFVKFNICFGIAMVILFFMILQVSSVSQSNRIEPYGIQGRLFRRFERLSSISVERLPTVFWFLFLNKEFIQTNQYSHYEQDLFHTAPVMQFRVPPVTIREQTHLHAIHNLHNSPHTPHYLQHIYHSTLAIV